MKKILYCFFIFVSVFLFSVVSDVGAKSLSKNDVTISFDNDDTLNMAYKKINIFRIAEDNSFYFNGEKHIINSDYTLVDNSISVINKEFELSNEKFRVDSSEKMLISNTIYQTYGFIVSIDIKEGKEYTFTQQICYKYDDKEDCKQNDNHRILVNKDASYNFAYDFLPFYNESIVFDYITYKFKLENDDESIVFDDISFTSSQINYNDFFTIDYYDDDFMYDNDVHTYEGKTYLKASKIENGIIYLNTEFRYGSAVNYTRKYKFSVDVCVGEDYSICRQAYTYDTQPNDSLHTIHSVPLLGIEYNSETYVLNYKSFKLKANYVCNNEIENNNCDKSRSENESTLIESEVYYLNITTPHLKDVLIGVDIKNACGNIEGCYASNSSVTNDFNFIDDNNILSIKYLITDTLNVYDSEIVNEFNNGDEITLDKEDGLYYIVFKISDDSGEVIHIAYGYLIDTVAPSLGSNHNFNEYSQDNYYNSIDISVSFGDDNFNVAYVTTYYLISDYNSVISKDEIIARNNVYSDRNLFVDLVDGSYKVCFVSKDLLDNYSDVVCSNKLNLDTTPLTKNDVEVESDNTSYQKSVAIDINVSEVEDNASFKCGLFLDYITITSENDLTATCYNNRLNNFNVNGENKYKLWIYVIDRAKNESLVSLDRVYYIDNKAPVVTYSINGDNSKYRNDVTLDVSVSDLNDIANVSYMFYLNSYNENSFMKMDINEGIKYPYDYYGVYKLAIKACDVLNNCKINTYQDIFYIDTGEIKLELIGKESVTLLRWGKYLEEGVKASKGNSGKYRVDLDYKIEGSVDTSKVGVYYITYSSGEGMNKVSVVREVVVKDSVPYFIVLGLILLLGEAIILLRLFIKKRKNGSI